MGAMVAVGRGVVIIGAFSLVFTVDGILSSPASKTSVLRFPLDEVGLTQSNNESCQWRRWQESAQVSSSLSPYVQIVNYEASRPVERITSLPPYKLAHV